MVQTGPVEPLHLRPRQVAALVGVSREKVFVAIRRRQLRAIKLDGCTLIPMDSVKEWIATAVPVSAPTIAAFPGNKAEGPRA